MTNNQSPNGYILINTTNEGSNPITEVVNNKNFVKILPEMQSKVIDNVAQTHKLEIGFMGKLLSTRMPNMAVYSSFLLCIVLLCFALMCILLSKYFCTSFIMELTKIIIPVVTMSLGYMFGKNDTK